jgi:hypothetical protein
MISQQVKIMMFAKYDSHAFQAQRLGFAPEELPTTSSSELVPDSIQ